MRWGYRSVVGAGCVLLLLTSSASRGQRLHPGERQPTFSKAAAHVPCLATDTSSTSLDAVPVDAGVGFHPPSHPVWLAVPAVIAVAFTLARVRQYDRAPPAC